MVVVAAGFGGIILVKQITHYLDLRNKILQQLEFLSIMKEIGKQEAYLNFVVVGARTTGVEICRALAELKNKIRNRDCRDMAPEMAEDRDSQV